MSTSAWTLRTGRRTNSWWRRRTARCTAISRGIRPRLLRPDRAGRELDRQGRRQLRAEPEDAARVLRSAGPWRAAGARGLTLTRDDVIRRDVSSRSCATACSTTTPRQALRDRFPQLFRERARRTRAMVADGLAEFADPGCACSPPAAAAAPPRHGVRCVPAGRAGFPAEVLEGI